MDRRKPCDATLRVQVPSGKVGDRRNRVWRERGVTHLVKRKQGVRKLCDGTPKGPNPGAVVFGYTAVVPKRAWPCAEVLAGSESRADAREGCQGTWEAVPSPTARHRKAHRVIKARP